MASLLKLLPNSRQAGVYQTAVDSREIIAAAKTIGLQVFNLDIGRAPGKNSLLEVFAQTLKFPKYFGNNWDALDDCLADLSWIDGKGWVLLLQNCKSFAEKHEKEFNMAIDILTGSAESWREKRKPFWVFVQAQTGWHPELPEIVSE